VKQEDLCQGKADRVWVYLPVDKRPPMVFAIFAVHRKRIKSIRMKCEKCGRRIMSSAHVIDDGDYIVHSIPPHKPRFWWKRNKPAKDHKIR
jgi:hypothetical protein